MTSIVTATENKILPSHVFPSPVNPSRHVQVKLPFMLVQSAFLLQSLVPVSHSSISTNE